MGSAVDLKKRVCSLVNKLFPVRVGSLALIGGGGVGVGAGRMKIAKLLLLTVYANTLTLSHSEQPKLYGVLAVLSAIGLI